MSAPAETIPKPVVRPRPRGGRGRAAWRERRWVVLGGLAGCVLASSLLAAGDHSPVRVAAALLLFCLAPGSALLCTLAPRDARLELGIVVASSLALTTVGAEGMLLLHVWQPADLTYIVSVVCGIILLGQLPALPRLGRGPALAAAERLARRAAGGLAGATTTAAHLLILGGAAVLWVDAVRRADLGRISGWGLLPALPVTYYLALALLTAGFAVASAEQGIAPKLLATYIVGLVAAVHATTAVLYAEPRYTWMYKHLGVINSIAAHGSVDRQTDIYSNWPGFFAANAWFSKVAGIAPISYAAWAQVFFELVFAATLLFVARGLTTDTRLQWMTVWFFLIANWIGQDYLAPQALGFALVLAVFGICMRYAPPEPRTERRRRLRRGLLRRIAGARARPRPDRPVEGPSRLLSPRGALAVGAICSLAVVVSHQLSPIMLFVGLAAFTIATGRIRLPLIVALGLAETGWLVLAWRYLNAHFSLFSFDLLPHPRPSGYDTSRGLPGVVAVANVSHALVACVALLAVAGIVRRRRTGHLQLPAVGLLVAPLSVVLLQSYGGEIFLRAYLFALPWLAYFAAIACSPTRLSTRRMAARRGWRLAGATAVIGAGFLVAYFGLEKVNVVSRDDIAAERWYEERAPAGSVMAYVSANFPAELTADYARVRVYGSSYIPQVVYVPQFRRHVFTERDMPALESLLRSAGTRHTYLVVSPSQVHFVRLYGILPRGSLTNLLRLLRSSPDFRLAYRHGHAFVFELTARPARSRPSSTTA